MIVLYTYYIVYERFVSFQHDFMISNMIILFLQSTNFSTCLDIMEMLI